jgi:hypothetical protein
MALMERVHSDGDIPPGRKYLLLMADFEKVIKLDGRYEMLKVTSCQLESYPSVTEWISAQDTIINDLAVYDITIEDAWRKFYIMSSLLKAEEW